jgi:hypothetical protein
MKKSSAISLGSFVLLCILLSFGLWKAKKRDVESASRPANNGQVQSDWKSPIERNLTPLPSTPTASNISTPARHTTQIPPNMSTASRSTADFDPSDFKGATEDPNVMAFLSKHRSMPQVGEVRSAGNAQRLIFKGKVIFEAARIDDWRSISQDGTVALAAVTDESSPVVPEHDIPLSERPSRIWLVDAEGNRKQISPPAIDASKPLIAPSGNFVAFTGSRVGGVGTTTSNQLFVVDVKDGGSRIFKANQPLDDYSVTAVEWSDGEKFLKVIEDHGETGGHMVMRQIRLE